MLNVEQYRKMYQWGWINDAYVEALALSAEEKQTIKGELA